VNSRWRKLRADFAAYRWQIILIALVLLGGSACMVAALDAKAVLEREIEASFAGARAPEVVLWFERVDASLLDEVARQPGVAAVAARRSAFARLNTVDGRELPLRLSIVADPQTLKVAAVHRHDSAAARPGLWLEQSGASLLKISPGAALALRGPAGTAVAVPLAGWLHDPGIAPSTQEQLLYGWATPAVALTLGLNPEPDQLLVKMVTPGSRADADEFGNQLAAWAKARGLPPLRIELPHATHPHALLMTALLRVLGVLSAIAFVSSAAWGAYMLALWLRREVRVIGILKTLGAGSGQVAAQYALLVLPLALLCAALALPLGAWLGQLLIEHHRVSLNIDVASSAPPPGLRWTEALLALGLPLLAMAAPVWRAARLTPRQAIADAGIAAPGAGRWRAGLLRWPGATRWTLALRNSFRRPWRLSLIVLALASGGALLLTTHSNYESLMQTIDRSLAQQGHDIEFILQRPAPAVLLETTARALTDVAVAEAWRRTSASLSEGGGAQEPMPVPLVGVPPGSRLFQLRIVEGRALAAEATGEVLVSRYLLAQVPGLRIGGRMTLHWRERRHEATIVGVVEEIGGSTVYAPFATFEAVTGLGDASASLRVKARSGVSLDVVSRRIDQALLDVRAVPAQAITRERVRDSLDEHFKVVGDFIRMVALASALVGAIWLAASSGLNVIERTREIGVLRALGATPRGIGAIFLAEGLAVTLLSAALAVLFSLVLTVALNGAAERGLLHAAVPLRFSWSGLAVLLSGCGVVLAAVALALHRVLRLSARDALAYE
jgi:putative ABC transport system permease protein